ncbi:MAG: mechanosensitive ion channel family protein, partial [Waterburya sp.]
MPRKKFLVALSFLVAVIISIAPPASAQLPYLQDLAIYSRVLRSAQETALNSACIRLDGRCLFKLAATDSEVLSDRINEIQKRFGEITAEYLADTSNQAIVTIQQNGNLQDIYLNFGDNRQERLFTVTNSDALANDVSVAIRARQLQSTIEQGLEVAIEERSYQYIRKQIIIGLSIFLTIWLLNFPLTSQISKFHQLSRGLAPSPTLKSLSILDQLARRQQWNLAEIRYRLLQIVQVLIWVGGTLFILNLIPQTRIISFLLIAILIIPFRISIVGAIIYILIRLTFFLIAKVSAAAVESQTSDLRINQRGKLRINTTTRIL